MNLLVQAMAPSPLRSPLRAALLLLAVLALASATPPPAAGKLPRLRGRVRRHTNATIFAPGSGTANATAARAQRAARRAAHPKGVHLPHSRKKRMTALGVVALVVIVLTLLCCACRRLRQWQRDRQLAQPRLLTNAEACGHGVHASSIAVCGNAYATPTASAHARRPSRAARPTWGCS